MSRSNKGFSPLYIKAIFVFAAALALSTSACGKKDSAPAVAGASPVAAAPTGTAAGDTNAVGTVAGTDGKADAAPAADAAGKAAGTEGSAEGSAEGSGGARKPVKEITEIEPRRDLESVVYYDPTGLTREQIFNKKTKVDAGNPLLGELVRSDIASIDSQHLFYSGSARDSLRTHLYASVNEHAATLDAETQALNKALSRSIQLASFEVNQFSRRAVLKFRFERPDRDGKPQIQPVTLQGSIDNVNRFAIGNIETEPFVRAEVACMDITGGCRTVHIRLEDLKMGGTAHLIARHTSASMSIDGSKQIGTSGNPDYDRLMNVLVNTARKPEGENVVEKLTLTTSETIGGASNFTVNMKIRLVDQWGRRGGDVLEFTGPLAKRADSDDLDISANISPVYTMQGGKMVTTAAIGTQSRFVESITDARIVKNDGHGNLQLELTVGGGSGGSEEQISLVFSRIHTSIGPIRLRM